MTAKFGKRDGKATVWNLHVGWCLSCQSEPAGGLAPEMAKPRVADSREKGNEYLLALAVDVEQHIRRNAVSAVHAISHGSARQADETPEPCWTGPDFRLQASQKLCTCADPSNRVLNNGGVYLPYA